MTPTEYNVLKSSIKSSIKYALSKLTCDEINRMIRPEFNDPSLGDYNLVD